MKPQVLFIGGLNKSLPEYQRFKSNFECIDYKITTKEQLINDFNTKFKNILAIYGAWLGFVLIGGFKNDIIDNAPPNLKIISICSVGYDPYDTKAMAQRNIILTNVPSDGAAEPVADLVLYNTLTSFRNFHLNTRNFTAGSNHTVHLRRSLESSSFDKKSGIIDLQKDHEYSFGETVINRPCLSPRNHHVVILGFGKIGQLIGKKLAAIGMVIHYVKRTDLSKAEKSNLGYDATFHSSLDSAKFADLVVISLPETPETRHLINEQSINSFDKPFRIINVGRGPVIDEIALVNGLKSGKILFAALDVFENEPSVNPQLFGRQDVVLTPHVGASTVENFDYTAVQALKNIENVLNGSLPLNKVN